MSHIPTTKDSQDWIALWNMFVEAGSLNPLPLLDGLILQKFVTENFNYDPTGQNPTYFSLGTGSANYGNEEERQVQFNQAGTFKGARASCGYNPFTSDVYITIRVNSQASDIVITIPAGSTGTFTSSEEAEVSVGDEVCWEARGGTANAGWIGAFEVDFAYRYVAS